MAALYLILVATLLASALADTKEDARKACSHIKEQDRCHEYCLYQYFGALDKDGRYVESKFADMLALLSEGVLTREQVDKISKTCNSLNEQKAAEGCARASQVYQCLDDERFKIIGRRM